ncbi:cupin domain-containing protein [Calothrix sp. 336/3]|uniref:cupin domain-containing protein n=1 Tax=Calothrix sp. 336/3 TaxID=1337936 RepID=UPI0004E3138E|nr:cupin domain-containing protein [Calothrix sp. 336/3]AKG22467.1 anti-ECF sigma factor ChrR [Calothrix sp. 336/3]
MRAEDKCFCELAPLYALNLLGEEESNFVTEQISELPELGDEMSELQAAVAAIAYTAPPVPMADNLKDRLFARIGIATPQPQTPTPDINLPIYKRSTELNWKPHRIPGVMIARLNFDPVRREVTCLLRAEAGVRYPLHRHAGVEEIFMLEGDLVIGEEVYGKGDYILSTPSSIHAPETRGGCMFFVRTSVDDEYPEVTNQQTV